MTQLLQKDVLNLPPIKPIDISKPFPPYHDPKAFCKYHHQPDHDTEKYYSLRSRIQDLIDNNTISIAGVNDIGKKYVAPPNQNLQIFTNPLPSHSTLMSLSMSILPFFSNDVGLQSNNMVNLIDKPTPPKDSHITFDPSENIEALDGPLYVTVKIKYILSRGVPIDPTCMVNLITEEYIYSLQLHQVTYTKSNVVVKIFDGFSCLLSVLSLFPLRLVLSA